MKIFVINLARAADRRKAMIDRLSELDLDFEWWLAVDGRQLTDVDHARFRREHPTYHHSRSSDEGHSGWVGCTRSHQRLCRHIQENWEGPVLVLEDDARLEPDWEARVDRAVEKFPNMELLLVGSHVYPQGRSDMMVAKPRLTHAYLILTQEMAGKLADVWLDESTEADEIWWEVMKENTTYALQPPAAHQDSRMSYITGMMNGGTSRIALNPPSLVDLAKVHLAQRRRALV